MRNVSAAQDMCVAIKKDGERCTRRKNAECGDYCKTHFKIMMKPETPPEVKMELKDDAPEKMKAMVPELFTTLSAEFVDISHTFEDDKLTIEFTMKDKDTIIAALAAKVREGASVKTCSLEFVLTACAVLSGSPGGGGGAAGGSSSA